MVSPSLDKAGNLGHGRTGAVSDADAELLPGRAGRHPRLRRHKPRDLHQDRKLARRARDVLDESRHSQDARWEQGGYNTNHPLNHALDGQLHCMYSALF